MAETSGNTRTYSQAAIPRIGDLTSAYGQTMNIVSRINPMRGDLLRDLATRVDTAIVAYDAVVEEEKAGREAIRNEVEEELRNTKSSRKELLTQLDADCKRAREQLAAARVAYSEERARNGLFEAISPFVESAPSASAVAGDTPQPQAPASALTQPAPAAQQGNPERPAVSRLSLQRLFRRRNRESVATENTLPDHSLAPAGAPPADQDQGSNNNADATPNHEEDDLNVRSADVHAFEAGLPNASVAADIVHSWPLMANLSLIACGAIFGTSLGLLLGVVDTDSVAMGVVQALRAWAVCSLFGVAVFYTLGINAEALSALIAEQYHSALIASYREDRTGVGEWMLTAAKWTAGIGALVFCMLIIIEALVERFGIVQLVKNQLEDVIVANHTHVKGEMSSLSAFVVALVASVPFMCYHAIKGWAIGRRDTLLRANAAAHDAELTQSRKERRQEIAEAARAAAQNSAVGQEPVAAINSNPKTLQESANAAAAIPANPNIARSAPALVSQAVGLPNGVLASPSTLGDDGRSNSSLAPLSVQPQAAEPVTHSANNDGYLSVSEDKSRRQELPRPVELARTSEEVQTCVETLTELLRSRGEQSDQLNTRVKELEARQVQCRQNTATAAERINKAYVDVLAAVTAFDRELKRNIELCESLAKGGYLVRTYRQLVRSAGIESGIELR